MPAKRFEYFYTHQSLGLLVVIAANEKDRQGQVSSTSKHKEAKKLDFFGCKIYSTASLQLRARLPNAWR